MPPNGKGAAGRLFLIHRNVRRGVLCLGVASRLTVLLFA